ncbi:HpsJ family protein [Chamaesiphon sp.]|uniref:HpsJ family protein n=1 Tax=Chamaesiphon sp. TaxID=2814140 RepID=UPI0035936889
MQPTVSSFLTPLALKTAGAVLILSSLIDLVFMLCFPPENLVLEGSRWWLYATSQLVDRGLLPLVGIAFVVTGDWIKIVSTEDGGDRGNTWRIGTFTLASLLGLIFILIIPFQIMTTNDFKSQDLKKIGDEVTQLEQGIKSNLQQINAQSKDKIRAQITTIDNELKSGQAQGERLAGLQLAKSKLELLLADPKKFAQESEQNLQQLQKQKQKAETQASERMLKTGFRTSMASLLLAIAYITIGWTGLRRVLK